MSSECVASHLRRKIQIQERLRVPDGVGGSYDSWSTVKTAWAKIEPLSSRETLFGMQLQLNVTHRITIRYTTGFDADYRILYGTRTFNIVGIRNPEERNKWLILDCEEGGAN